MINLNSILDEKSPYYSKVLEILSSTQISNNNCYEKHHIIPKFYFKHNKMSIDNSEENLKKLTAKNHFLIHYYYFKSSKPEFKSKLAFACIRMHRQMLSESLNEAEVDLLSEKYEEIKVFNANSRKGIKRSKETSEKISKALKGKPSPNKGKKLSELHKKALSESHKKVPMTKARLEGYKKSSKSRKGKLHPINKKDNYENYWKTKKGKIPNKSFDRTGCRDTYNSVKILKISTNEVFSSIRLAAEKEGIKPATLWAGIKKGLKKYNDYKIIENKKIKKVLKISTNEIFNTIKEAADNLNVSPGAFSIGINKNFPKYSDYKFIYD